MENGNPQVTLCTVWDQMTGWGRGAESGVTDERWNIYSGPRGSEMIGLMA